jgi:hypothetical protein
MIVPYSHVLFFAGILFAMGVFCAVARRNLIMMLISVWSEHCIWEKVLPKMFGIEKRQKNDCAL